MISHHNFDLHVSQVMMVLYQVMMGLYQVILGFTTFPGGGVHKWGNPNSWMVGNGKVIM